MPRYRKLGYVALNVSDLARARTFYEGQLGLQPSGEGAHGEAFFRCGFEHHAIALYHGTEPGLKRIGFELETPASVEDAARHFAAEGLEVAELAPGECAALHIGRAFRIVEPFTGATFEFYGAMREFSDPLCRASPRSSASAMSCCKVPDLAGASDFYTGVLGFRSPT